MRLDELLAGVGVTAEVDQTLTVRDVALRPEKVKPGDLFCLCRLPWLARPGRAAVALRNGAAAVLLDDNSYEIGRLERKQVPIVRVPDANQAYAKVCSNYFGNAHRDLALFGVTGTKGKSTTCHLIEEALRGGGLQTGVISSVMRRSPRGETVGTLTTPEPYELHETLKGMLEEGATHVVLEASSIGLAESRLHGVRFDAVVFTNLGSEHLEYHGGKLAYGDVKRTLFCDSRFHRSESTLCVVNADDPFGVGLMAEAAGRKISYGIEQGDMRIAVGGATLDQMAVTLDGVKFRTSLVGRYNALNLLAAYIVSRDTLGSEAQAMDSIRNASPLPGRRERVATRNGPDIFVDYAHTPEGVAAVLDSFAEVRKERVLVAVAGCSGSSDKAKRPMIAQAAIERSDLLILTTENPRFEDPLGILREMEEGVDAKTLHKSGRLEVIPDRQEAINLAIRRAHPAGIVVILGRGSERFQEVGGEKRPFDDREAARKAVRKLEEVASTPIPHGARDPVDRTVRSSPSDRSPRRNKPRRSLESLAASALKRGAKSERNP